VSCVAVASVESFTSTFWRRDHVSAPYTLFWTAADLEMKLLDFQRYL
jgi:hypothetical protein